MNNRELNNYTTLRSQYTAQADLCNGGVNPIVNPFPAAYIPDLFSCGAKPHSWPPSSQPSQCSTLDAMKKGDYRILGSFKQCDIAQ